MVRNKDKTKTPSPILPLLLMIKFSPSFSIPAPSKWHRGELQSVHDGSSLLLSPTHTFPLLQYRVPPHKIQSFMNCSCVGSPRAPENLFLTENLFLRGLLPMGCSSCQDSAVMWAPHGWRFFQDISTCCSVGFSTGCTMDTWSTVVLHRYSSLL